MPCYVYIFMASFVVVPGKSLLWVALLLLIVIYMYSVISFAVLRDELRSDATQNMFCDTLDECLITVLRFGLIENFLVCNGFSHLTVVWKEWSGWS